MESNDLKTNQFYSVNGKDAKPLVTDMWIIETGELIPISEAKIEEKTEEDKEALQNMMKSIFKK